QSASSPPPAVDAPPDSPSPTSVLVPGPAQYSGPATGIVKYEGAPIVQNAEIVFRNLPPGRLVLEYDQNTWEARLEPGEGSQRLVMRNKKPGTQNKCLVSWHLIQ